MTACPDHQSKPPDRLFSMVDYEKSIIEQHYRQNAFYFCRLLVTFANRLDPGPIKGRV